MNYTYKYFTYRHARERHVVDLSHLDASILWNKSNILNAEIPNVFDYIQQSDKNTFAQVLLNWKTCLEFVQLDGTKG